MRKNPQIICREERGRTVLIDPYRRTLVTLNDEALEVWRLLDGERTPEEIVDEMETLFDADRATLAKDVARLLKELERREMIV
jgi:hypothetical protein